MAYRNDKRDNYDRRTRTARGSNARTPRTSRTSREDPPRSTRESAQRTTRGSRAASDRTPADRSARSSRTRTSRSTSTRSTRAGRAAQSRAARQSGRVSSEPIPQRTARSAPLPDEPSLHAVAGGRYPDAPDDQPQLVSTSVGELRRAERAERMRKSSRRYLVRIIIVVGIIVALLAGWAAVYNSPLFTIQNVQVNGVAHLTDAEVSQLVNVPEGTTLLRVDTDAVADRMKQTAWVNDVEVKRVFPDTLEVDVTERAVKAIVEIPTSSGSAVKKWAIAEDHVWLMPIPEADSEGAKTTSAQIYEDEKNALHIVDVPYGTKAEIGKECVDNNVNNALDIVSGMTTELAGRVQKVSAAGPAETTLTLDNGVEIAFGKAEDIRDKERVILKILEENPDGVAYINVRMVDAPTWRAV